MPEHIASIISEESDTNNLTCVIPTLAELLARDSEIKDVYLCHESAVQIWKSRNEGAHFCGYRNMQMICLALAASGVQAFPDRKLSILELQDMIESAWGKGINAHAMTQTGGIKGTRKHVGTSEVILNIRKARILFRTFGS